MQHQAAKALAEPDGADDMGRELTGGIQAPWWHRELTLISSY